MKSNFVKMKVMRYKCKKCGREASGEHKPNSGGCPMGGTHVWYTIDFG